MPTYRLDLAYDGAGFHGLARQPGQRTIQGEVERALSRSLRTEVVTVAAGRTDAGVHARQQVMSFQLSEPADCDRLLKSLGTQLYPEIVPYAMTLVSDSFDARRSAAARSYRYRIYNETFSNPWHRHAAWHLSDALDIELMNEAAGCLLGEHDFAAFCRSSSAGGTVRRVLEAEWTKDEFVMFAITARSFCHQMVRSIVGLSVDIGRKRRSPEVMAEALSNRDRSRSGQMAPAEGLILWRVDY
jgi:tRNA pseudouridine38-40 synthase